jgi:hypothetical protein
VSLLRKLCKCSFLTATLLINGCGDKDDKKEESTNLGDTAASRQVESVISNIHALAIPPGALSQINNVDPFSDQNLALSAPWDGPAVEGLSDPRNSGEPTCPYSGNINVKTRMQLEFTDSAKRCNGSDVNVFGKLNSKLSIVCAISRAFNVDTSDQLPSSGTQELTLEDFRVLATACNADMSKLDDIIGVTISFSAPTTTTTYDRLLTVAVTSSQGSMTNTSAIKFNATSFNYAEGEYGGATSGSDRTIIAMDQNTGLTRVEYMSGLNTDFNGFYHHRLYYDATNNLGMVFSDIREMTDGTAQATAKSAVKYVVKTKPTDDTQDINLNFDAFNTNNSSQYSSEGSMNLMGCANRSNGALSTVTASSNEFTCSGVTSPTISTYNKAGSSWTKVRSNNWSVISASSLPVISWDHTNLLTTDAP